MDLFLDNTWESKLVELMVHYTGLSKNVNIIKLSEVTQKISREGVEGPVKLVIPTPLLTVSETECFNNPVSISLYLAQLSGVKNFLFGTEQKAEFQHISKIEVCKTCKDLIPTLNKELETKTFFFGAHVSFSDLAIFFCTYKSMIAMDDQAKWENCNFFRWFNHIQNLPQISSFLEAQRLPKSSFPQKARVTIPVVAEQKKAKGGTQAPPKGEGKQKQQQQPQQQKKEGEKQQQQAPKEKADKKADKKAQQPAKKKEEPKTYTPDQPLYFEQYIDIRVGELKKVWKHPDSEKLWCEEIDVGEPELRQIASGLQEIIPIEGMTGKVCVMTNLKPRPLKGFASNGMVMCSSTADKSQTQLLRPPADAKVGDRIMLEGFEGQFKQERLDIPNSKKKVLENAFPLLKCDAEGCATYSGLKFKVAGGYCKSESIVNGTVA